MAMAKSDLQSTCTESDQIYDAEVASITCGTEDLPFDYSLFESLDEMQAAYQDDVERCGDSAAARWPV